MSLKAVNVQIEPPMNFNLIKGYDAYYWIYRRRWLYLAAFLG